MPRYSLRIFFPAALLSLCLLNQSSALQDTVLITGLTVSNKTSSSVSLTWNATNGNNSNFLVRWTGGSVNTSGNTNNTFYTVVGLIAGANHTFTVSVENQTTGEAQISAFTNPNAVANFTVSSKTSSSVSVSWDTPQGNWSYFMIYWSGGDVNKSSNTYNTSYTVVDLTAGVSYTFTVTAVAADNQTMGAPTQISVFTNPAPVNNLSVTNKTTSSVSLKWNQPGGTRNHFIVNWTDGNGRKGNSITSDTLSTVTGLTSGVNYTFTVTAVAADNQTAGTSAQISVFTVPAVVLNFNGSTFNQTTSSVFLTWNESNGILDFEISWTDGNNSYSNTTSAIFYTVTGLTAGTKYTFTVTAVAADGNTKGAPTQIQAFTKPNAVTNLSASYKTPSSVSLTWSEPNGNRNHFIVKWTDDSGTFNHNSTDTTYTVPGLTAGLNYTFTVTAVAADGQTEGAPSQISVFTNPNPVTNLTASIKTTSSVSLTWKKPPGNWSLFTVHWTSGSDNNSNNTLSMSYTVTGLTAGLNYTFTVTAVAADGQTKGAPSQITEFTLPNSVTNLTAFNNTTSSVSLTWNKPLGNWSIFTIHWTNGSVNNSSYTSSTSYTVTGLTAGVNYTFTVTAVAADGQTKGAPTQISVFTNPDVVRNLSVSGKNTSSVSLTWSKTHQDWSFEIEWTNGSTLHNSIITPNAPYTITGLIPGVNYSFTVTAVAANNLSKGVPTQISTFTNPEAVTELAVSNKDSSSVSLTWKEPVGFRSFFNVSWTDGSVNFNSTYNTSCTVTDLSAGVRYTFTVTAVAADGQTEGLPSHTSAFTMPNLVSNLNAYNKTTSSVSLSWNKPEGNWSFFIVNWTDGSLNKSSNTSITSYTVTGLTAGVNYTFTVTAVAADGQTFGKSIQISSFTKPDVPRNLKFTEITISSVFLNWTPPVGESFFFKLQWSNDNMTFHSTTRDAFFNITNLNPGVNYIVLISAVAADNTTEGEAISLSAFTEPDTIRNLTSFEFNTTTIFLDWIEPVGKWSFFKILTIKNEQLTTSETAFNFTNLEPGTNYTFAVSAVAADNETEGSLVALSTCTGASPVLDINCTGPNRTSEALLKLTWTNPPGNNQGFNISLSQSISVLVPPCHNVCSYNFSKNLEYFHTYSVIISTLGCGESGTLEFMCKTGITEPPVPSRPEDVVVKVTPISQSIINLQFNASLLNSANGPVEAYGVLLSTEHQSNISHSSLRMTYRNWEQGESKTYLSVLKFKENKMTRSNMITVVIGNNSDVLENTAYKNGPLNNQEYRVALVLFTYLEIQDELVEIQQSIFSLTPFATSVAKPLDPSSNMLAITLGVLLPVIVLLIIAIIVLVIQKRKIRKEYTDIPVNNLRTKISIPVRVEDFEAYYKKQQLDSNCGFAEQYEDLKAVGTAQTKTSALAVENKMKNRYNNVLPYDSSRVKLSIHGSPFDDYINANYISGYNSKKEYIAAQGPLPATVNEFWRMIWEKHAHTIVMLTKCYELGRVKCEKYWPPESKLYNNILVSTTSEIELEDWTLRDFTVKNVKTAETRNVRQFHFTAWPDHGVPETTEVLINFRHLVREHIDSFSGNAPTVVHCSAGVGRTGTFVAVDHLIYQIERESMVDIFGIIYDMRMHRPLMVQTEDQYVFLNHCASDIIKSRMGTNVDLIYQNTAAFSIYENVHQKK